MKKEFTATVYIIENKKVLLIYHRKLEKWLPPGGHIEENETPSEAAKREVLEETGWEIEFLMQENIWIKRWNAVSIERPYFCLLENIPPYQDKPEHQHIDFIYVARPIKHQLSFTTKDQLRWFSLEEVEQLEPDVEVFEETKQVLNHLLSYYDSLVSKSQFLTKYNNQEVSLIE